MNDLKEQAKKIIAKGKLLGDVELINMGLDMLDSVSESLALEKSEILDKQIQSAKIPISDKIKNDKLSLTDKNRMIAMASKGDITDQFRTSKESVISAKYGKKVSILSEERSNKFIDDGTDASDLRGKTPEFKPAERNRKARIVSATCQVCGKVDKVNEIFTIGREFYRCESCLLKGKV